MRSLAQIPVLQQEFIDQAPVQYITKTLLETINSTSNNLKMLEYFTYKKVKKHQAEKKAETKVQSPILNEEDEHFLSRIISEEGPRPALPTRPHGLGPVAGDDTANRSQLVVHDDAVAEFQSKNDKGKGKAGEEKKGNRLSGLVRSITKKVGSALCDGC